MRYIPLQNFSPEDEWVDNVVEKFAELVHLEADERNEFINANSKIWGDLKTFLSDISNGKCWYSEAKEVFSDFHVDHFRPKNRVDDRLDFSQPVNYVDGYWWLAFDYTNYRLAGAVGNTYKKDKFAVIRNKAYSPDDPIEDELAYLIDPTSEYDVELLTFDETGRIYPLDTDTTSMDYKRADYTIRVLKLESHAPLKEARREAWELCERLLNDIAVLKMKQKAIPSVATRTKIEEKMSQLRELKNPTNEFTMTIEACIASFRSK